MPKIAEIMSTDVVTVEGRETLRRAAKLMQELDVGSLPVCDGSRLQGMVTDRDITIRGVAEGLGPDGGCVQDVMTEDLQYCTADQDSEEVLQLMGDKQVRRLPVVNRNSMLVGIVSLGDLATRQGGDVDQAVREICSPDKAAP